MREIKFRAWDLENNYMFQVHTLSLPINLMVHTELMQFTGVEIYDGDIVKYEIFTKDGYSCVASIVEFKDFGFVLREPSNVYYSMQRLIISSGWKDIEVIGNIYENPELLDNK